LFRYLSTRFEDIIIKNKYSHVLFLRIDWYFKSYFLECLCFDDKIRFGFPDLNSSFKKNVDKKFIKNLEKIEDFHVNHGISQFPQKYYHLLFDNKIICNLHHVYKICLENDIDVNDIDFFIKTLHTACSKISWNPIFANCGREEKLKYIDHPPYDNRFLDGNVKYYVENGYIILNTDDKYSKKYNELLYSEILPWSVK